MNNLLAIKDNRIFYLPHPKLQPYIAHYTISKPKPPYIKNLSIIPDASGCIMKGSIRTILYFETDDSDAFIHKLKEHEQIKYIHEIIEYVRG